MNRLFYYRAIVFTVVAASSVWFSRPFALANEPAPRTTVVYPASATSRVPITIGPRRDGVSPVKEEEPIDVVTPLGQIETTLKTLDAIRESQERSERLLVDLAANWDRSEGERAEELLAAIERSAEETRAAIENLRTSNDRVEEKPERVAVDSSPKMERRLEVRVWTIVLFLAVQLLAIVLWTRFHAAWLSLREVATTLRSVSKDDAKN